MATTELTDKQQAWIDHYIIHKNATKAARLAGYETDDYATLRNIGSVNLSNPNIRAELDRRFRARAMTADEVIERYGDLARFDPSEWIGDDGKINIAALRDSGLGHFIRDSIPMREGRRITLANPDTGLKWLGRHLGLDGQRLDVTVEHKPTPQGEEIGHLVDILRDLTVPIDDSTVVDDT